MEYEDFLKGKMISVCDSGFNINESDLNEKLFGFQKFIVRKALKKGKYAIFADTGLGKSFMQIEWAYQVAKKLNGKVLILAPLAVGGQTIIEAKKLGYQIEKLGSGSLSKDGLYITNYEQIDNLKNLEFSDHYIEDFTGIVLDESSILKNFMGKTRDQIIETFKNTPYKLACTATPSPNDLMELGNHSEFLNYMNRDEMLAMFFTHDGGETAKWRLKDHGKKDFYSWIGTWADVVTDPKDLGFDDESKRYKLPGLEYFEHQVKTDKKDNGMLFNESSVNATDFNKELRETIHARVSNVIDIVKVNGKEQILIWVNQNEEGDLIEKQLKYLGYDARQVKGADSIPFKESTLLSFANSEFQILITKGKIAGMGLNFQSCHIQIFASLDFSFEKLYQSVRRSYRFGQTGKVYIYLITTDTMQNVIETIKEKEKLFDTLRKEMSKIINYDKEKFNKKEFNTMDKKTDSYHIMNGDSVQRIKEIESESIGYSIFSPPFSSLYVYSDHLEDMGNSKNDDEFYLHFGFLVEELYRILKPGRCVSFHCMNLPNSKQRDGFIGIKDFRGDLIRLFQSKGFIYHSEVCIWKDPVTAMQRTKAIGLLHKQVKKDSALSRQGIPDYLVTMRKPGVNVDPISGEFDHFQGDMGTFENNGNLSIDVWQRYASPVWMDINPSNTLQYRAAREDNDERHIAPLQLDVIHRGLQLWSKKGDKVFTPFLGIGSEVYEAVKMGRYGIGCELKESYFEQAIKNLASLDKELTQLDMFDSVNP